MLWLILAVCSADLAFSVWLWLKREKQIKEIEALEAQRYAETEARRLESDARLAKITPLLDAAMAGLPPPGMGLGIAQLKDDCNCDACQARRAASN